MAAPSFALPVDDPRTRLWLPVTVRVAWELLLARERVHPAALTSAREHVLRSLPDGVGADEAEVMAGPLVRDWLERARHRRYNRPVLDPDASATAPRAWRDRLFETTDPIGDAVLRMHYGDSLSLEEVERHAAVDLGLLEAAQEGLREAMRAIAASDGQPVDDWPEARIDGLLYRVATLAGPNCPGPVGLLSEAGREHAGRCPRCSRAVRLIRQGVLSPADLFIPEGEPQIPAGKLHLLAILLHPDARKHKRALVEALGPDALPVGADAWLLPADQVGELTPRLAALAELGTPPRHMLRGAIVEGPGRALKGVLLGPVPVAALDEARSRPWSEIDGVGELPATLPPPPRATGWWLGALAMCALTAGVGALAMRPPAPDPLYPIETLWQVDGVRFDTDDLAKLDVVVLDAGGLRVREAALGAEKGQYATGEGDFFMPAAGGRLMLITSATGVPNLDGLVAGVALAGDPLETLAARVREADPRAVIAMAPTPESR